MSIVYELEDYRLEDYRLEVIEALTKLLKAEGTSPELLRECHQFLYWDRAGAYLKTDALCDRLRDALPFEKVEAALSGIRPPLSPFRLRLMPWQLRAKNLLLTIEDRSLRWLQRG
jgi:hypothetical protein